MFTQAFIRAFIAIIQSKSRINTRCNDVFFKFELVKRIYQTDINYLPKRDDSVLFRKKCNCENGSFQFYRKVEGKLSAKG